MVGIVGGGIDRPDLAILSAGRLERGTVTARRSTLWRTFDFLWSLHIMDFKDHEDFNTPLLIISTALALIVIVTGIVMFPSRLGYSAWRRRRAAARGKVQ